MPTRSPTLATEALPEPGQNLRRQLQRFVLPPLFSIPTIGVQDTFGRDVDFGLQWWYFGSMKTKTSITLSRDILSLIDEYVQGENNRSAFIELAVRTYLEIVKRGKRDQHDLSTINRLSEKLNKEAADVLKYQTEP